MLMDPMNADLILRSSTTERDYRHLRNDIRVARNFLVRAFNRDDLQAGSDSSWRLLKPHKKDSS